MLVAHQEVSRLVPAPRQEVWDVLTDLDRRAEVLSAVVRVERVDDGDAFGVGTRWRETRRAGRREETQELEATEVDAPSSYRWRAEAHGSSYAGGVRLEPVEGGRCTRVVLTFGGEAQGLLPRALAVVTAPVGHRLVRRALETDLHDVHRALGSRG